MVSVRSVQRKREKRKGSAVINHKKKTYTDREIGGCRKGGKKPRKA